MGWGLMMRRVILPQATRRMVPAFANRMIEAVKATSLASTIAVADLMWQGEQLARLPRLAVSGDGRRITTAGW